MSLYAPLFRALNAAEIRQDLIQLKRLANRSQDLEDIAKLEQVLRLKGDPAGV